MPGRIDRDAADARVRFHVNGTQFIDERVATFTEVTTLRDGDTPSIEESQRGTGQFTYYLVNQNFSVAGRTSFECFSCLPMVIPFSRCVRDWS